MKEIQILTKYKNEISPFEQAIGNMKQKIFYLIHLLLKYQDNNKSLQIIVISIEMIQLVAFSFSLKVPNNFIIEIWLV